jgi:chemotaxis protein histidine kinase CheA
MAQLLSDELQAQVEAILQNMSEQKTAINEAQKSIANDTATIITRNTDLLRTIIDLRARIATLESKEGRADSEINQLKQELQIAKQQLSATEAQQAQRQRELNEQTQRISDLNEQLRTAEKQKEDAARLISELRNANAQSENSLADAQRKAQSLQQSLRQKDEEIDALKAERQKLDAEQTKSKESFEALQSKNAALQANITQLEEQISVQNNELATLRDTVVKFQSALSEAKADQELIKAEYASLQQKKEEGDRIQKELDDQLARMKTAINAQLERIMQQKRELIDAPVAELGQTARRLSETVRLMESGVAPQLPPAAEPNPRSQPSSVQGRTAAALPRKTTKTAETSTIERTTGRRKTKLKVSADKATQNLYDWLVTNVSLDDIKNEDISKRRALSAKLIQQKMNLVSNPQELLDELVLNRYLFKGNALGGGEPDWNDTLVRNEIVYWPNPNPRSSSTMKGGDFLSTETMLPPMF